MLALVHHWRTDIRDAWAGLLRRPLRSILSSIGIAIGVAALVAMLSIGEGARQRAIEQIQSLGMDTVRIESSTQATWRIDGSLANLSQGITEEGIRRLGTWLDVRGQVGAFVRADDVVLEHGDRRLAGMVLGVDPDWIRAEELHLARGRSLVRSDLERHARVCVVGVAVGSALMLTLDDSLRFRDRHCRVVGWLEPKGRLLTEGTGLTAVDFDRAVLMPRTAFPFPKGFGQIDGAVVRLTRRDETAVLDAATQIDLQLLMMHREVRDFRVLAPATLMREARETQRLFGLVMGSIAGLSLLVGGIGIMNVMLANIAEQTREIGLRIAVGATRSRIVLLFLIHSVLLTVVGGVVGVLAGVAIAMGVQAYAGWPVAFAVGALLVGPVYAVTAGVVFGLYPAFRAASLNPAVSLREA